MANDPFSNNRTQDNDSARHWRARAKCLGTDTDRFEAPSNSTIINKVKKSHENLMEMYRGYMNLCFGCPVMRECARDAIANEDTSFVRGGVPLSWFGIHWHIQRNALQIVAAGGDESAALSVISQCYRQDPPRPLHAPEGHGGYGRGPGRVPGRVGGA